MEIDTNNPSNTERSKKIVKRIIIEVIIAVLIIISAVLLGINLRKLVINRIFKGIELKPNSIGYNTWLNPPRTITRDYYLFNISNSNEVLHDPSSITIHVKDTPPYSYLLSTKKQDIQWSNDNKAINYSVYRLFNRHQTRFKTSSLNDTGVFVDLLRAISRTKFDLKASPEFFSLTGKTPFYHRNAIEQLEGFTSDLFVTLRERINGSNTAKSGFIYRQNGSRLYNVSIQTGKNIFRKLSLKHCICLDLLKKGQVNTFDSELVPFNITSPTDYPFPIYDSLTYPPLLPDKSSLNIFNPDFCHPILIEYNRSLRILGINIHEYKMKLIDINNCTNPSDTTTCNEVNRIDVSKCISPSLPENTIFLSKPHFYGSSNETIKNLNIDGFTPSSDKHDSFVYFEPHTGTPFKAVFRMQLNVEAIIDPMKISEDTSKLQSTGAKSIKRLIPIYWMDEEMNISKEIINKFRRRVLFIHYGQYAIIFSATILAIIIIIILQIMGRRADKDDRYTYVTYNKSEVSI